MKVLRALYLGTCLILTSPLIFGWVIYVVVISIIDAVQYKDNPMKMINEVLIGPMKYAAWLYGNIIRHGNKYSQYSYDEFTI